MKGLFRDNPRFAGKLVLLDRIKWFEGPSAPSDNHAWFVWDRRHQGPPWIAYAGRVLPPERSRRARRSCRGRQVGLGVLPHEVILLVGHGAAEQAFAVRLRTHHRRSFFALQDFFGG